MGKNAQSRRSVLAQFSVPRLPRQATDHWPIACGNCGKCKVGLRWASRLAYRLRKLRKAPPWPARRASRQKLGWCGKVGNPFFSYIDTKVFLWGHWVEKWHDRRTARRLFGGPMGIAGRGSYGAHLLRGAVAKSRELSENFQSFQCGKAANPGQWCLLIPAFCVPTFGS